VELLNFLLSNLCYRAVAQKPVSFEVCKVSVGSSTGGAMARALQLKQRLADNLCFCKTKSRKERDRSQPGTGGGTRLQKYAWGWTCQRWGSSRTHLIKCCLRIDVDSALKSRFVVSDLMKWNRLPRSFLSFMVSLSLICSDTALEESSWKFIKRPFIFQDNLYPWDSQTMH